ncbi:hypothetical protein K466DRAFT_75828 [Polyporus arcularius HHB13444]|uniref:Uncharacterized protein n=1 Tax=Polyporus arcularius HHB13444 TaxID=1314778 RepID=A0A5C3NMP1_9APHY|nr:hypothetical protein K466DRAFT_75828 [Polyporus arcularius HHB13444]
MLAATPTSGHRFRIHRAPIGERGASDPKLGPSARVADSPTTGHVQTLERPTTCILRLHPKCPRAEAARILISSQVLPKVSPILLHTNPRLRTITPSLKSRRCIKHHHADHPRSPSIAKRRRSLDIPPMAVYGKQRCRPPPQRTHRTPPSPRDQDQARCSARRYRDGTQHRLDNLVVKVKDVALARGYGSRSKQVKAD